MNPFKDTPLSPAALSEVELDLANAFESFAELYQLLEEYSPVWYSEDTRLRAQFGLRELLAAAAIAKEFRVQREMPTANVSPMQKQVD